MARVLSGPRGVGGWGWNVWIWITCSKSGALITKFINQGRSTCAAIPQSINRNQKATPPAIKKKANHLHALVILYIITTYSQLPVLYIFCNISHCSCYCFSWHFPPLLCFLPGLSFPLSLSVSFHFVLLSFPSMITFFSSFYIVFLTFSL